MVDFFGKPLAGCTIAAAVQARIFERIVVSTDSDYLKKWTSEEYGDVVKVLDRPDELGTDQATVMQVANHVLDTTGEEYDYVFIMLPSNPFRTDKDIVNIKNIIQSKKPNGVVAVCAYNFPVIYAVHVNENGMLERSFPEMAAKKSQESPSYYTDNGAIYALKPQYVRDNNYFPIDTYPYVMPIWAVDIDTPEDFEVAKAMYHYFVMGDSNGV